MPYVDDHTKARLPSYPYDENGRVAKPTELPHTAGQLTYLITRQIQAYLESASARGVGYENLAVVMGALEGAKADFISRVLLPYEATKIEDNGDVWPAHLLS